MAKFELIGEDLDELREELNEILKRIYNDLESISGRAGDIPQESRIVTQDDVVFDKTTKGMVLKDDGTPPRFWRVWVDSSGSLYTETLGGSY